MKKSSEIRSSCSDSKIAAKGTAKKNQKFSLIVCIFSSICVFVETKMRFLICFGHVWCDLCVIIGICRVIF